MASIVVSVFIKLAACPLYHGPPQHSRATPLKDGSHRSQTDKSLTSSTNKVPPRICCHLVITKQTGVWRHAQTKLHRNQGKRVWLTHTPLLNILRCFHHESSSQEYEERNTFFWLGGQIEAIHLSMLLLQPWYNCEESHVRCLTLPCPKNALSWVNPILFRSSGL